MVAIKGLLEIVVIFAMKNLTFEVPSAVQQAGHLRVFSLLLIHNGSFTLGNDAT
jgi:hypothetical protein